MLLAASAVAVAQSFVVAHYNVLAGYLGDNRQPWFLHGIDVDRDNDDTLPTNMCRRDKIFEKFYERNDEGKFSNVGWPSYVDGILSDEEQQIVERVDRKFFSWQTRSPRLIQQIQDLNADLISVVECDKYESFWKHEMEQLGYGSIYKQRPYKRRPSRDQQRIDSCRSPEIDDVDGCAIFYRKNVFELEASQGIELLGSCSSSILEGGSEDNSVSSNVGGDRVALLSLLRHNDSGRRLIFISTHLARNPEDPNKTRERARQITQLLYQLTLFAIEHNAMDDDEKSDTSVPAMIAGDMNETNLRHIATIARIKCGLADEACHPLVFSSKAPKTSHTSVTACRQMCIDYLLMQTNGPLKVKEVYDLDQGISLDDPIPNERHPSDHLPIAFRMSFQDYDQMARNYLNSWEQVVVAAGNTNSHTSSVATITNNVVELGSDLSEKRMLLPSEEPLRIDELRIAYEYCLNVNESRTPHGRNAGDEGARGGGDDNNGGESHVWDDVRTRWSDHIEFTSSGKTRRSFENFTIVYIQGLLSLQSDIRDRIQSIQTVLDIDLTPLLASSSIKRCEGMSWDLLLRYVIENNFRNESFLNRVRGAFSFFDFDSSARFNMMELHEAFSLACPFMVKTELICDAFDCMNKDYDEKISLDDFSNYLIRTSFNKDPSWDSLLDSLASYASTNKQH